MNFLSITVEDAILIILDDLNNAKDVFPLSEVNTVTMYPFYQALIALKDKGLINTSDSYQPQPYPNEAQHRLFSISISPTITLDGIKYLADWKSEAESAKKRLAGITEEQVMVEVKKLSITEKIANTAKISGDLSKIQSTGESTVSIIKKVTDLFLGIN
ncbi:hypothetical protein C6W19_18175 [Bacillus sp. RJGP41]|nr:hypothetical protein C6W19_18175 [Bacillus sp. RJGP41]